MKEKELGIMSTRSSVQRNLLSEKFLFSCLSSARLQSTKVI